MYFLRTDYVLIRCWNGIETALSVDLRK